GGNRRRGGRRGIIAARLPTERSCEPRPQAISWRCGSTVCAPGVCDTWSCRGGRAMGEIRDADDMRGVRDMHDPRTVRELLFDAATRAAAYLAQIDERSVAPDPAALAALEALDVPVPEEPSDPAVPLAEL